MNNDDFTMRLCGCDVTVTWSDAGDWAQDGMGRSNSFTGRIQLSTKLTEATRNQTFLHELVHMILDFHGYGEISRREGVVNALSLSLLAWMRDNPALVRVLAEGVPKDKKDFQKAIEAVLEGT